MENSRLRSLFLEHRCQSPSRAAANKLAWCHIEPIVACGTVDNAINFYLDEVRRASRVFLAVSSLLVLAVF
jgi:hypothetical protein